MPASPLLPALGSPARTLSFSHANTRPDDPEQRHREHGGPLQSPDTTTISVAPGLRVLQKTQVCSGGPANSSAVLLDTYPRDPCPALHPSQVPHPTTPTPGNRPSSACNNMTAQHVFLPALRGQDHFPLDTSPTTT